MDKNFHEHEFSKTRAVVKLFYPQYQVIPNQLSISVVIIHLSVQIKLSFIQGVTFPEY